MFIKPDILANILLAYKNNKKMQILQIYYSNLDFSGEIKEFP